MLPDATGAVQRLLLMLMAAVAAIERLLLLLLGDDVVQWLLKG